MAIRSFAADDEAAIAEHVGQLVRHGVDTLQIRNKALDDRRLGRVVRIAVDSARRRPRSGLRVLVNGRADLAVACRADGVHLPSTGVPAKSLRQRFPTLLIGLSTHHFAEIDAARGYVDYVTFSPIFETPSQRHPGQLKGRPQGLEALAEAARRRVPIVALGGIQADRLEAVAEAGAHGVAAIRALQDPGSLVEMAAQARRLFPMASENARISS